MYDIIAAHSKIETKKISLLKFTPTFCFTNLFKRHLNVYTKFCNAYNYHLHYAYEMSKKLVWKARSKMAQHVKRRARPAPTRDRSHRLPLPASSYCALCVASIFSTKKKFSAFTRFVTIPRFSGIHSSEII